MPHRWDNVFKAVGSIAGYKQEFDDDPDEATKSAVAAAFRYAWDHSDLIPPDHVYPLPNGGVMFEWIYPGDEIRRLEFETDGTLELMKSWPGTRPAEFAKGVNHLGIPIEDAT